MCKYMCKCSTLTRHTVLQRVEYPRRQDLPPAYQENGAFYIHRTADCLNTGELMHITDSKPQLTRISGGADLPFREHCRVGQCKPFVMGASRSADVDTIEDLRWCEAEMERMLTQEEPQRYTHYSHIYISTALCAGGRIKSSLHLKQLFTRP